jgi:hypothetical protein
MWQGECPRCGIRGYFSTVWSASFSDRSHVDVVECPGSHPFIVVTVSVGGGSSRGSVLFVSPVSGDVDVPNWLPDQYKNAYAEMMFDLKSQKYRSSVAMAGIILDAHINSLLRNPGDKRMPLARRMEILSARGHIDQDQFADGTVARLSRNEVVHPEEITNTVSEIEAREAIDAVSGCLERYYKFRRAKALPAPAEQIGEEGSPKEGVSENNEPPQG